MTVRPPRTFKRLMAKAAQVETIKVNAPTDKAMVSELVICDQKWSR